MLDLFRWRRPWRVLPSDGEPDPDHPGWPETTGALRLPCGWAVRLRPLASSDGAAWRDQRLADESILRPVEPTLPQGWQAGHSRAQWWATILELHEAAREGQVVPFAIEVNGAFAGQLTLGNIQRGVVSECWIGYWVFSRFSGRKVATVACALGTDHAFRRVGVHRVTATFLPSNPASGRVLRTNGFHHEGYLRGNLHIDGRWRDHHFVAQLKNQFAASCVTRLRRYGVVR